MAQHARTKNPIYAMRLFRERASREFNQRVQILNQRVNVLGIEFRGVRRTHFSAAVQDHIANLIVGCRGAAGKRRFLNGFAEAGAVLSGLQVKGLVAPHAGDNICLFSASLGFRERSAIAGIGMRRRGE